MTSLRPFFRIDTDISASREGGAMFVGLPSVESSASVRATPPIDALVIDHAE
jgi:hypothetical protein